MKTREYIFQGKTTGKAKYDPDNFRVKSMTLQPHNSQERIKIKFSYDDEGNRIRTIAQNEFGKLRRVNDSSSPSKTSDGIWMGDMYYDFDSSTNKWLNAFGLALETDSVLANPSLIERLEKAADFISEKVRAYDRLDHYLNTTKGPDSDEWDIQ